MKPRKICVVTGSRAEYGLLFWLMKGIQKEPKLELQIIATGMHLSPEFGFTYKEIEKDGFHINKKVEMLLSAEKNKIENQIFNVGYQNMSINKIAQLVKEVVEKEYPKRGQISILRTSGNDIRSYHINSEKIKKVLGFEPKKSIEMAIKDLCNAFKQGKIINSFENDLYFNVSRFKNIKAK